VPPSASIAVTAGEPGGIGPDLCLRLADRVWPVSLVVIADPALLRDRAAQLGLAVQIETIAPGESPRRPAAPGRLYVHPVPLHVPCRCGQLDPRNAEYVLDTLREAVDGCLDGRYAAMVTAPVHKGIINDAGIGFTGHTEFIAERSGGEPVMMLACPGLRVALVTTHLPLRAVADAITPTALETAARTLDRELRNRFGIERPHILVCGLNPHAGEGGHLGREEIEVIEPVLERLRADGLQFTGPLPADTLFTEPHLRHADAVLAMYHDQGLPVLKHKGFGSAVNITLGLPIIRTSVDHGTALELAGSGRASPSSLFTAVQTAIEMIRGGVKD